MTEMRRIDRTRVLRGVSCRSLWQYVISRDAPILGNRPMRYPRGVLPIISIIVIDDAEDRISLKIPTLRLFE